MIFDITFATLLHMSHLFGVILAFGAVIATDVIHSLLLFKPKTAVWMKNLDPILSLLFG